METSVSLLDRLASAPSERDWQRMVHLYQMLRAWCLRSGVSEADADDLSQDTLTGVVREVEEGANDSHRVERPATLEGNVYRIDALAE